MQEIEGDERQRELVLACSPSEAREKKTRPISSSTIISPSMSAERQARASAAWAIGQHLAVQSGPWAVNARALPASSTTCAR